MKNATVKVTHIGNDYAYVNIYISTPQGGQTIEDIEVSRHIGEVLAKYGMTEGEEFER